jgi:hypothetical protein
MKNINMKLLFASFVTATLLNAGMFPDMLNMNSDDNKSKSGFMGMEMPSMPKMPDMPKMEMPSMDYNKDKNKSKSGFMGMEMPSMPLMNSN